MGRNQGSKAFAVNKLDKLWAFPVSSPNNNRGTLLSRVFHLAIVFPCSLLRPVLELFPFPKDILGLVARDFQIFEKSTRKAEIKSVVVGLGMVSFLGHARD